MHYNVNYCKSGKPYWAPCNSRGHSLGVALTAGEPAQIEALLICSLFSVCRRLEGAVYRKMVATPASETGRVPGTNTETIQLIGCQFNGRPSVVNGCPTLGVWSVDSQQWKL